jgi:copper chaperone CopZ
VRGALEDVPGVKEIEVAPGDPKVLVRFDPAQVSIETLLGKLAEAGRPAKRR